MTLNDTLDPRPGTNYAELGDVYEYAAYVIGPEGYTPHVTAAGRGTDGAQRAVLANTGKGYTARLVRRTVTYGPWEVSDGS